MGQKCKTKIFKAIFEKKIIYASHHTVLPKASENKLNAWNVRHLRRAASIRRSFWSHVRRGKTYSRTNLFPLTAHLQKLQAAYLGHDLRVPPDDPIRFVMRNDVFQQRQFFSGAPPRQGRPSSKGLTEVVDTPPSLLQRRLSASTHCSKPLTGHTGSPRDCSRPALTYHTSKEDSWYGRLRRSSQFGFIPG